MCPTRTFELGFDDTIPRAHRLDHLTISNVHADMPVVPDCQTRGFGDRVNRSGDACSMIHFIRRDIRHTVRVVDDFFRLRIQPAVALDESDAVRRSAADPRLADEICIASKSIRILRQLRFKQALGQHMTERSPDVAPVFFVGVNGVLHQIVGVLPAGFVKPDVSSSVLPVPLP